MNMNFVKDFRLTEISRRASQHIQPDSTVIQMGYHVFQLYVMLVVIIVTGGGYDSVTKKEFAWVNTMIVNVKNSITGTYHADLPPISLNFSIDIIDDSS